MKISLFFKKNPLVLQTLLMISINYGEKQLPIGVQIKIESEKQREMFSKKTCKPVFSE